MALNKLNCAIAVGQVQAGKRQSDVGQTFSVYSKSARPFTDLDCCEKQTIQRCSSPQKK